MPMILGAILHRFQPWGFCNLEAAERQTGQKREKQRKMMEAGPLHYTRQCPHRSPQFEVGPSL